MTIDISDEQLRRESKVRWTCASLVMAALCSIGCVSCEGSHTEVLMARIVTAHVARTLDLYPSVGKENLELRLEVETDRKFWPDASGTQWLLLELMVGDSRAPSTGTIGAAAITSDGKWRYEISFDAEGPGRRGRFGAEFRRHLQTDGTLRLRISVGAPDGSKTLDSGWVVSSEFGAALMEESESK